MTMTKNKNAVLDRPRSQVQAAVAVVGDEGGRILQTFPTARRLFARVWNGERFEPPASVLAFDDDPSPIDSGSAVVLLREDATKPWKVARRESLALIEA